MEDYKSIGLGPYKKIYNTKSYPKVVKVIAEDQIIISTGKNDGVSYNDEYAVYEVGEELFHPDTNESLGYYEVYKGRGKVAHVMDKMAVLDHKMLNSLASVILNERSFGFKNAKVGDEVRKVMKNS